MKIGYLKQGMTGVTWWRLYQPLAAMAKAFPQIDFVCLGNQIELGDLMFLDALYISRPTENQHIQLMRNAKDLGVKVIVDFDDDLHNVPKHNPAAGYYEGKPLQYIYQLADAVWVSTLPLLEMIKPINPNTFYIPNAVSLGDLSETPSRNSHIVWRGSGNGAYDVEVHKAWFNELLEHVDGFTFIGYIPPWGHVSEKVSYFPWTNPLEYFRVLDELQPGYIWKPLDENQFNVSKSNIAQLEAAMLGALCISNYPWPGVVDELKDDQAFDSAFEDQMEIIEMAYDLEKVNTMRVISLIEIGLHVPGAQLATSA